MLNNPENNPRIYLIVFFFVAVVLFLELPFFGYAASPVLPDCNKTFSGGKITDPCGFKQIKDLADNVLKFIVTIAVPIATIAFVYAGVLYLTAGGSPGKISRAHGIFLNVAIGLGIVLSAWLIVKTVLEILATTGNYINIFQ